MTTDDREAALTAFALNDPGLSAEQRAKVETVLAADPQAREAVAEVRAVAGKLSAAFRAELLSEPAAPATDVAAVPSERAAGRRWWRWPAYLGGVAALVACVLSLYDAFSGKPSTFAKVGSAVGGSAMRGPTRSGSAVADRSDGVRNESAPHESAVYDVPKGETTATTVPNAPLPPAPRPPAGPPPAAQPGFGGGGFQGGFGGGQNSGGGGGGGFTAIGTQPVPTVRGSYAGNPRSAAGGFGGVGGVAGLGGAGGMVGVGGQGGLGLGGGLGAVGFAGGALGGVGGFGGGGGSFGGGAGGLSGANPGGGPLPVPPPASGPAVAANDSTVMGGARAAGRPMASDTTRSAVRKDERLEREQLGGGKPHPGYFQPVPAEPRAGGDQFPALTENPFVPVKGQDALSTFGVDVDTASYGIVRNYLSRNAAPPTAAVRLEEVVNYFPYQDKPPAGDDPFAVTVEVADCPWHAGHRLARIGLKAKPVAADKRPPSNLVFLIDVSGSMYEPNKLPLVKASLKLLVGQLGENDRVAMVVYAGTTGVVLDSTSATHKDRILAALDRLEAGGSTNGAGGIQQAYDVAAHHFLKGGTNRVILCTDGDWNVGTTGTDDLVRMIEDKRKTGVFLSVFGFGMGNLRDEMMVKLAGKGNGNYGYIDTLREANKALVEQLGGTLITVAKDVKIQVEFNPAAVSAYRLLGYEKRALAAKDFADDTKDAGEMGAGHVVTALYELVPVGGAAPAGEGLRYQQAADPKPAAGKADEAFTVKMRHKTPDGDVSRLRELPVANTTTSYREASEDFRFAAAAAAFALVLRDSAYKGDATLGLALGLAEGATRYDPSGYRAEFVDLVRKAQAVSGKR